MLLKLGVDISRLNREIRRALPVIENVYRGTPYEPVITATYEGNHSTGSLHYANDAVDVRLPFPQGCSQETVFNKLKKELGKDYDVVLHKTHYHIEYDPK